MDRSHPKLTKILKAYRLLKWRLPVCPVCLKNSDDANHGSIRILLLSHAINTQRGSSIASIAQGLTQFIPLLPPVSHTENSPRSEKLEVPQNRIESKGIVIKWKSMCFSDNPQAKWRCLILSLNLWLCFNFALEKLNQNLLSKNRSSVFLRPSRAEGSLGPSSTPLLLPLWPLERSLNSIFGAIGKERSTPYIASMVSGCPDTYGFTMVLGELDGWLSHSV